jgi:hypothetical protein
MLMPLKLAIVASGRTQRDIARAAGIPEKRLSDIVVGLVEARPEERQTLAALLDAPESGLFDDDAPTGTSTDREAGRVGR